LTTTCSAASESCTGPPPLDHLSHLIVVVLHGIGLWILLLYIDPTYSYAGLSNLLGQLLALLTEINNILAGL
jgi:hypothetical protein